MIQTYSNHIARNYIYIWASLSLIIKKNRFWISPHFQILPTQNPPKNKPTSSINGLRWCRGGNSNGLGLGLEVQLRIEMKPRSLEQPAIQVSMKVIVYNFIYIISTLFVISIMVHEFDSILIYIIYLNYVSTSATLWVPNSWSKAAPSAEVLCLCRLCPSPWAWHLGKLPDEIGVQNGPNETHALRIRMVPLLNFEELWGIIHRIS